MVKIDMRCKCGARWHGTVPRDMVEHFKEQFLECHTERGCKVEIVSPSNARSQALRAKEDCHAETR